MTRSHSAPLANPKNRPSGKTSKKSYRHVDTVSLGAIKSFFEFDETENGLKDAVWICSDDHTSDGRSFKQYPFVLTSQRDKFIAGVPKELLPAATKWRNHCE